MIIDTAFFKFLQLSLTFATPFVRDVAQPGSALAWGARGRKFESCRPDIANLRLSEGWLFLCHITKSKDSDYYKAYLCY
jgi:hypothetical protein